jgi:hypothetical protein
MRLKKNVDGDIESVTLSGCETLLLSKISERLIHCNHLITVEGEYTKNSDLQPNRQTTICGKVIAATRNAYIRGIIVLTDSSELVSVGGNNATSEDFKAQKIVIAFVDKTFYKDAALMEIMRQFNSISKFSEIEKLVCNNDIQKVVEILKQLSNDLAAMHALLTLLNSTKISSIDAEHLCEAFRNFQELCCGNEKASNEVTLRLIKYIDDYIYISERTISVIYAIESLGYIARYPRSIELAYNKMLILCKDDKACAMHEHIPYVTFVVMLMLDPKKVTPEFFDTYKSEHRILDEIACF